MELKSKRDDAKRDVKEGASTRGAATEHAETEFRVDDAFAETLRSLHAINTQAPILTRVIDHACSSEQCISHRVVAMLRQAQWKLTADLHNDQPLDACGYIAADAVCCLREKALAEADNWHHAELPDYSMLDCVTKGDAVLNRRDDNRILDALEVNQLVRNYFGLDQRPHATEEWHAGAVALDMFLSGVAEIVRDLMNTRATTQHKWKAWIVNTQSSKQYGSHWFTVIIGRPVPTPPLLLQSTAEHRTSASSSSHLATDATTNPSVTTSQTSELPDSSASATAGRASSSTEHATTGLNLNNCPNLCDSPDPALSDALCWAHANAMHPDVASWQDACSQ